MKNDSGKKGRHSQAAEEASGRHGGYKDGDGERIHFEKLEEMAQQVFAYVKQYAQQMDKKTLLQYVSVATPLIFGLRKNSFIGRLVVTLAAGMVARYILEALFDEQLNEEEESEEEMETA